MVIIPACRNLDLAPASAAFPRSALGTVVSVGCVVASQPGQSHPLVAIALLCVLLWVLIADGEIAWLDPSLTPPL